jgi:hypothetical protein
MPVLYVRLSLMTPTPGDEDKVSAIMDDLLNFFAAQRGFVAGYKLKSADASREVGRVTVWRSEAEADTVAQMNHVLARRSELTPMIVEGSHQERSFVAETETRGA